MKTSNIILISLFGSITVFILAAFTELRINGIREENKQSQPSMEKQFSAVALSPVKYIVIGETTNLTITRGEQTELAVRIGIEDNDPIVQHQVHGDTLFIDKIAFGTNGVTLMAELKLDPDNLKWISATQSSFSISNMSINGLIVDIDHTRLALHSNQNIRFGSIKINGTNSSDFSASNIEFDSVHLNLDHSSAWIDASAHQVDATLKNESTLSASQADNITSSKDKSSRIN